MPARLICLLILPSEDLGFPKQVCCGDLIVAVATQTGLPHEKVRERNMYKGVNLTSFKKSLMQTICENIGKNVWTSLTTTAEKQSWKNLT